MKRFITKKVVMKMKDMYRSAIVGLLSYSMIPSTSGAASKALNIISGHISNVEISKKVSIE